VKTLNDKINQLKEFNNINNSNLKDTIDKLKDDYSKSLKEKESTLNNEFLSSLNMIYDTVTNKHNELYES